VDLTRITDAAWNDTIPKLERGIVLDLHTYPSLNP